MHRTTKIGIIALPIVKKMSLIVYNAKYQCIIELILMIIAYRDAYEILDSNAGGGRFARKQKNCRMFRYMRQLKTFLYLKISYVIKMVMIPSQPEVPSLLTMR